MKSFEDYLAEQSMIAAEMHRADHRRTIQRKRTREERRRHRHIVAKTIATFLSVGAFIAACTVARASFPKDVNTPAPIEPVTTGVYPVAPIPEAVLARMEKPVEAVETIAVVAPTSDPEPVVESLPYTEEELEMLALVIFQEAGGDAASDECRQMVGEVVLNRVADHRFPDTIEEVLLQKRQYGRLSETGLVWPARAENPGEVHAVERAYACAEALLSGAVEPLLPKDAIWQAEFKQGNEVLAYDSGLYFCR